MVHTVTTGEFRPGPEERERTWECYDDAADDSKGLH